jgi:hypothetical protein
MPPVDVEETPVEEIARNAKEIIFKAKPSPEVEKLPEYSPSQLSDTERPDLKFTEGFYVSDTQSDTRQLFYPKAYPHQIFKPPLKLLCG